jgi:hypothetical protein
MHIYFGFINMECKVELREQTMYMYGKDRFNKESEEWIMKYPD